MDKILAIILLSITVLLFTLASGCLEILKPTEVKIPEDVLAKCENVIYVVNSSIATMTPIRTKITEASIENYTFPGRTLELCCVTLIDIHSLYLPPRKSKYCSDGTGSYSVLWLTSITGKFYKSMENYKLGGSYCTRTFDENGNVKDEQCS